MRITNAMMDARVLTDLRSHQSSIARSQSEVSSGKRLQRPSDDALATRDALRHRSDLDAVRQYREDASAAGSWLDATDAALQSVTDLSHTARELAVQGANDVTGPQGRQAIAAQIDKLIDSAKAAMNTKVGDAYIFGGTATTTPPYQSGSVDTYEGNGAPVVRAIGPGVSLDVSTTGATVLGSGGTDGNLLATLRSIKAHLTGGTAADLNALRSGDLAALDVNLTTLTGARAGVGASRNRVDAADARLTDLQTVSEGLRSDAEDSDIAESLMSLSSQQAAYQAALRAGAQILQPSLMDFLH